MTPAPECRDASASQEAARVPPPPVRPSVPSLAEVAPHIVALARAVLGRKHPELDDVIQESLLAIHEAAKRFRGDSSFLHYARRIAVRTALAARRRGTAQAIQAAQAAALRDAPAAVSPEPSTPSALPASERIDRERQALAFCRLLDELPGVQAETLALRVLLGHSLPEVAEATGAPLNTVRSRIRIAKDYLRERISNDPELAAMFDVEGET